MRTPLSPHAVALCCLIVLFSPIHAFSEEGQPSSPFYVAPEASWLLIDLPDYAPIAERQNGGGDPLVGHVVTVDNKLATPKYALTVGWKQPASTSSDEGWFVEANGNYYHGSTSQSGALEPSAGNRLGWFAIDGIKGSVRFFVGEKVYASTNRDVKQFGGELLAGKSCSLGKSNKIVPFFGVTGMRIDQDFSTYAIQSLGAAYMNLNDTVTAHYFGATGGIRFERLETNVIWNISLAGTMLYADAKYKGEQFVSTYPYDITYHTSASKVAYRANIKGGLEYLFEEFSLGLTAGAEYLSDAPKIIASSSRATLPGVGKPTRIGWDRSMAAEVGVNLKYSF